MSLVNRYWKADLTSPPVSVNCFDHTILEHFRSFTQPPGRWLLLFYRHRGVLGLGARAYPYEPGTVAIIPPGSRSGHDKVGPGTDLYWMEFSLEGGEGYFVSLPLITKLADPQWLIDEIEGATKSVGRSKAQIQSILWATLWRLSEPASYYRDYVELYEAEKYILDHLHEPLRINDIASRVGVSTRTILRMFRQAHGVTVEEYIRSQKVETARRLLATTSQPIKSVATRIGISSYQHFNKLIREATGLSPNAYRENAERSR